MTGENHPSGTLMTDIVDRQTRSRMMSGIKGSNTKPELLIRKALHKRGFRYRLHSKNLAGKPDIVLPKYKAVIFVNGCFWHKHDCHLFRWPKSRTEFWKKKITGNVKRDNRNARQLEEQGWRILTVWECSIKGKYRSPFELLIDSIESWLLHGSENRSIPD